MEPLIAVDSLSKHYGDTCAVEGLSFTIGRGEVVGLLGPNGAGKTTTLRILTGYMPPTSGRVTLDGIDVVETPLKVRQRIGYLPESVPLYDDMGVFDYLDFIARVRRLGRGRGAAIRNMVARCGLGPVIGKGISDLSKGYRQRLGLAQAMIHNPDVVILDEPTSGLDPNQILEIRNLIRDLGREKTVILSTHILQEVDAVCDRVLIIHHGKVVADASPERLHAEFRGARELALVVRGPDETTLSEAVRALGPVDRVRGHTTSDGAVALQVVSPTDTDLREAVFRLCVARQWILLEMAAQVVSMEDIFRQLTREETS